MQLLSGGLLIGTNYNRIFVLPSQDAVLAMHSAMLTLIRSAPPSSARSTTSSAVFFLKKHLNLE